MTKPTNGWTPARRAAQREHMLKNRPWERSTGPKTVEGKKKASRNALKTGIRTKQTKAIKKYLRDVRHALEIVNGGRLRDDRPLRYKNDKRTNEMSEIWPIPPFELMDLVNNSELFGPARVGKASKT